tara:strand:+ start:4148 stop:5251 length:1104 start_codon:yes stop_codon:yes gene_type:complete
MIGEVVYINGGEVYKELKHFNGSYSSGITFNLIDVNQVDPITSYVKYPDSELKHYSFTKEARKWYLDTSLGISLSNYDLCSDVTLWWGKGVISEHNYTLYFKVDSTQMLHSVSEYYGLPYPINATIESEMNTIENISMYYNAKGEHLILGAIKFIEGTASMLKMHCFYREDGVFTAQKCRSLYNGGLVFEQGTLTSLEDPGSSLSFTGNTDTQSIEYRGKSGDPLFSWEAVITEGDTTKIKHYESSKQYRTIIAHLTTGNTYESYDLCPSVNTWIGRSWVDSGEEELYFYLESSSMIEAVATYYGLPEPCDLATKARVESNPAEFRLRHQDINQTGSRDIPVVVASIVFNNNVATMFKLYEITRWNE